MEDEKMLAVRISPELLEAVKDYATDEKRPIRKIIEEIIRFGLEEKSRQKQNSRKEQICVSYDDFVKARARGEIVYASQKKMLAVRISPELMEAIRSCAVSEKENINNLLEEFIHLALAQKSGEKIGFEDLAPIPRAPFRKRREMHHQ